MSCERLSDRMAGVLAGRDHWSREDEEHLAVCADCRSEWHLLARGAALGAELPVLDAARISAAIQGRLAGARRGDRNRKRGWIVVAFAAAAALALVVLPPGGRELSPGGAIATSLDIPVLELDSLSVEQLEAVLETIDIPLGNTSTLETPMLQELDDHQLEQLLRSLEG